MNYSSNSTGGYGKRPLWQWILIYVVIGGVIYAAAYYFFFAKKGGGYTYPTQTSNNTYSNESPAAVASSSPEASGSPVAATGELLMTKTDSAKGKYLAAANDMTLYVFDKDTKNVSNCTGGCLQVWPAYLVSDTTAKLPANLTTFKRADGTMQYAYKGKPIYFYQPDQKPGDTLGDGVNGTWHLVTP